jgi:hypothetical protein
MIHDPGRKKNEGPHGMKNFRIRDKQLGSVTLESRWKTTRFLKFSKIKHFFKQNKQKNIPSWEPVSKFWHYMMWLLFVQSMPVPIHFWSVNECTHLCILHLRSLSLSKAIRCLYSWLWSLTRRNKVDMIPITIMLAQCPERLTVWTRQRDSNPMASGKRRNVLRLFNRTYFDYR